MKTLLQKKITIPTHWAWMIALITNANAIVGIGHAHILDPVKVSTEEKTISGTVKDEMGNPIPGVTIVVDGTNIGTATDIDGNFLLEVPDEAVLFISYIGYQSQRITVGNQTSFSITLKEDQASLEEVVVTALGIKREAKRLGYATSSVTADQINVNRTPNFMNALQGKIAGVNISSLATGPAGTSKIRIRGQSSVGGQNNPLIVLNGMPIDNTNFGVAGNVGNRMGNNADGGDGLSSINPDDIESMTVLKGAAAAALYGSRAKDGVIMINTKNQGVADGIGVEWNTNFTADSPLDYTDFQYEYGQGENGIRPTSANPTSGVWSFGERFQPGMTQILFDGVEVPYVPVRNRINQFYRMGHTLTNTLTLSSRSDRGGFNLSLANMDNEGIEPNSRFNRRTVNLGFTQDVTSKLNVSGNINYSIEENRNPPIVAQQDISTAFVVYTLSNSMPLDLLEQKRLDEDGNEFIWSRFRNRTNPYMSINERFEKIKRNRIFGNIALKYNFTDWLYVQGRVAQDFFVRDQEFNFPTGLASLPPAPPGFENGRYVQDNRRSNETNADLLIGINRGFGDFNIDLTLGGNAMYRSFETNSVAVTDFVIRDLYTVQNGRVKDPIYLLSERKVNSVFGAAEFSFRDYLFLNVTGRNDWFSTLSPENRSIVYPSVTGSFVFSQWFERFPDWVNFGKLRAAYAEVGSDTDVPPYSNNLFFGVANNLFANPLGQLQPLAFVNTNTVPNPNLRPMRVKEYEIGLELKLFDNRIGLDFTYYDKVTLDQILAAQISDASGYTNSLINVGESKNYGMEMLLNLVPVRTNSFQWDFTFNGSYNRTRVLTLGLTPGDTTITVGGIGAEIRHVVGRPMGELYGFGYLRDEQGRQVFSSANGRPLRSAQMMNFGTAIPVWVGGFNNAFNYKGINMSFLIDFKLGHKMHSFTNFNVWRHGLHKATLEGRENGFVIGDGVNENGEANTTQTEIQMYYETVAANAIREEFIYNAGFWQLRQVTAGYDFTRLLPDNFFVKGLRLNAVANNVLLLKKWVPNIHPEQLHSGSDNLVGLESTSMPLARSVGFNLNARF
ncbi:SusC/RagA family TonB-linked outer membrane protein [Pleomorphovibrio marinus]|uniref:SusC/RagA family TonB-linked outer membrane protein n=1 Tax=Pleomorphovibrio marinus TaxID=2164132 RepID=UPI001E3D1CF2|nr:SusC/RagA family TonB-linked outer membrane protein [Pleomorphovibrio marinus]